MPRTIPAEQADETISDVSGWVRDNRAEVIVARDGEPEAVIIPYADYESFQAAKEQRRREAGKTLRRLREEIAARNADLTDEEAEEIADQATRDAIQGLVDKGKVRFVEP